MKTLYVVSSHFMPLIADEDVFNPSLRAMRTHRIFYPQRITKEKLTENFNKSKPLMMAFKTKDEASVFIGAALRGNNSQSDFIEGHILFFAVPVIYTVEVGENVEKPLGVLNGEQVYSYMQTETIPYFHSELEQGMWKESTISCINKKIQKAIDSIAGVEQVTVYQVPKEKLKITEAFYWGCNPAREVQISYEHAEENPSSLDFGCRIL